MNNQFETLTSMAYKQLTDTKKASNNARYRFDSVIADGYAASISVQQDGDLYTWEGYSMVGKDIRIHSGRGKAGEAKHAMKTSVGKANAALMNRLTSGKQAPMGNGKKITSSTGKVVLQIAAAAPTAVEQKKALSDAAKAKKARQKVADNLAKAQADLKKLETAFALKQTQHLESLKSGKNIAKAKDALDKVTEKLPLAYKKISDLAEFEIPTKSKLLQ